MKWIGMENVILPASCVNPVHCQVATAWKIHASADFSKFSQASSTALSTSS